MKSRSRAQWLELVKALDESGARTGEFAAERGLNPRTLGWWRSLFRREGVAISRATSGSRRARGRLPRANVRVVRVAVTPSPEPLVMPEARLTLEVGSVRVVVTRGFERATLASVLTAPIDFSDHSRTR